MASSVYILGSKSEHFCCSTSPIWNITPFCFVERLLPARLGSLKLISSSLWTGKLWKMCPDLTQRKWTPCPFTLGEHAQSSQKPGIAAGSTSPLISWPVAFLLGIFQTYLGKKTYWCVFYISRRHYFFGAKWYINLFASHLCQVAMAIMNVFGDLQEGKMQQPVGKSFLSLEPNSAPLHTFLYPPSQFIPNSTTPRVLLGVTIDSSEDQMVNMFSVSANTNIKLQSLLIRWLKLLCL